MLVPVLAYMHVLELFLTAELNLCWAILNENKQQSLQFTIYIVEIKLTLFTFFKFYVF